MAQNSFGIMAKVEEKKTDSEVQIVEFMLGNDLFAIELYDIKEVIPYAPTTPLPNTPPYIIGIINLRGEITTVIDLKLLLQMKSETTHNENACFIVLDPAFTKRPVGILVDEVLAVSTYTDSDIDRRGSGGDDTGDHIIGVIKKKTKEGDKERTDLIIWIHIRDIMRQIHMS